MALVPHSPKQTKKENNLPNILPFLISTRPLCIPTMEAIYIHLVSVIRHERETELIWKAMDQIDRILLQQGKNPEEEKNPVIILLEQQEQHLVKLIKEAFHLTRSLCKKSTELMNILCAEPPKGEEVDQKYWNIIVAAGTLAVRLYETFKVFSSSSTPSTPVTPDDNFDEGTKYFDFHQTGLGYLIDKLIRMLDKRTHNNFMLEFKAANVVGEMLQFISSNPMRLLILDKLVSGAYEVIKGYEKPFKPYDSGHTINMAELNRGFRIIEMIEIVFITSKSVDEKWIERDLYDELVGLHDKVENNIGLRHVAIFTARQVQLARRHLIDSRNQETMDFDSSTSTILSDLTMP